LYLFVEKCFFFVAIIYVEFTCDFIILYIILKNKNQGLFYIQRLTILIKQNLQRTTKNKKIN